MREVTVTTKVYTFDELSDDAKEKARNWYREAVAGDNWFSESVIEDAERIANILGIEIDRTRPGRSEPCIFWSGFSSQGDGACFEGSYSYKVGGAAEIRKYAPKDLTLHNIADDLVRIQRSAGFKITADTKQRGHYSHSGCMVVNVQDATTDDQEEAIRQALRDFADWIYRTLENEYEFVNSDEQVDETIRANEYDFTEDGDRF